MLEVCWRVLEVLEAAGQQEGGLGFSQASATVRRCADKAGCLIAQVPTPHPTREPSMMM